MSVEKIKNQLRQEIINSLNEMGFSQGDLAKILGIDRRAVNKYLNAGFKSTSINKLLEMLEALGVDVELRIK